VLERQSYEPFGAGGASSLTRYEYTGREKEPSTKALERELGRELSQDEIQRIHGDINKFNRSVYKPNFRGFVDLIRDVFKSF
jgi:hypothetical protein